MILCAEAGRCLGLENTHRIRSRAVFGLWADGLRLCACLPTWDAATGCVKRPLQGLG